MKVEISQELLSGTLSIVGKAVSTRAVNPVLNHVHIVAEKDNLTFTATDGDFTVRRQVAISGATPGRTLAPARLLSDLVSRLPKKDILLKLEDSQLNVSVGRSNYDLTVMGDENFPELPDYQEHRLIALSCVMFKRALEQTVFSAVKESSTGGVHYTNGVLFSFKGGRLDVVATDGHRLALKRSEGLTGDDLECDLLMPARVADELEKMLPNDEDAAVDIYHFSNQAFFKFGNQLVVSALLDVKFPDYERVIPKDVDSKVHVNREELNDALARVLLVCRQKDQNPVCSIETREGTMVITSDAGEVGKGQEEVEAEVSGGEIKISLNPAYVIDVLKVLGGDQVTFNWINEVNPVMFTSPRDPDYTYIVMPIRMD
ncbi:DNA polymerase III subunit beta [bacterium]|nr:DNA polymerase III subunit beta [bacterium]